MQIGTASFYGRAQGNMAALSERANALQTQISTGKRLTSAADDVVGYHQLAGLTRDATDATADKANATLASAILQQTDSALASVSTAIQRAQELTVQAGSGALNDTDKAAIATQLRAVLAELVGTANGKDARGTPLFGGTSGSSAVTIGADGSAAFASDSAAAIPVGGGVDIQANESAARVFGNLPSAAGGTTDLFKTLADLATALDAGGDVTGAVATATSDLQTASDQLTSVQASVGARAARLDLIQQSQTQAATTREESRSAIEDTDVTAAITELQKTMTVLQATQASFTKLAALSLFDYLR